MQHSLNPGQIVQDLYAIERKIGEGGFGDIFLAQHLELDIPVALKVMRPDEGNELPDLVERFQREVDLAKRLEHPNIVRMYDIGQLPDGTLYMTMEFVDGEELEGILVREGRLPLERALHIIVQTIDALAEAHNKGIVHRDLKPANIMLTQTGGSPDMVKLLDFGIAKAFDGTYTDLTAQNLQRSVGFGTPQYMAPEQIMGQNIGPYTDLYAIGLIFIELVTGAAPMLSDHPTDIIRKQLREEVPIPVWLDRSAIGPILRKLVQKDLRMRYQTASSLYQDIEERLLKQGDSVFSGVEVPTSDKLRSGPQKHTLALPEGARPENDTINTANARTLIVDSSDAAAHIPTQMVEAPPDFGEFHNPTLLGMAAPPQAAGATFLGVPLPIVVLIGVVCLSLVLLMLLIALV